MYELTCEHEHELMHSFFTSYVHTGVAHICALCFETREGVWKN